MIFPTYQNKEVEVPKSVQYELTELGLMLSEVVYILENGFDCSRSKRKKDIIEKCMRFGNKVVKVVAQKKFRLSGKEFWRIRHAGIMGMRREWV